jgi:tripartite-type tricarboxylate transporter receptor subunit TctC
VSGISGREFGTFVMKKRALFVAVMLAALASSAQAQDYPTRVVTLVAPFPPGGPSDTTARLLIGPMSKALGQQVIVENVTGAGGVIGSNRVAKAAPDGYTLIVSGSGTHAAAEFLNKDLPYRSTDFAQIGLINTSPVVLVARSGVPADTLKDFVAMRLPTCTRRSRPIAARPRRRWIWCGAMSTSAAIRSSISRRISKAAR